MKPRPEKRSLIDVGGVELHPPQKDIVGQRLALLAEAGTYGLPVKAGSPRYDSMKIDGSEIEVHFKDCSDGLVAHDLPAGTTLYAPQSTVQGFAICGEDRKWVWADAVISGEDKVIVSAPGLEHPVALRYAWSNNPTCNLFGKDGWPRRAFSGGTQKPVALIPCPLLFSAVLCAKKISPASPIPLIW